MVQNYNIILIEFLFCLYFKNFNGYLLCKILIYFLFNRIDKELSFIYLEQIISIFLKNRILKNNFSIEN